MDISDPVEDEPKSEAWYEAEVDRMLLQLKRMRQQTDPGEERRRSEAHRADFDTTMAEINKILNAIVADRRMSYPSPEERQASGPRSTDKPRQCKRRRKVSSLRRNALARNATYDHSLSGPVRDV